MAPHPGIRVPPPLHITLLIFVDYLTFPTITFRRLYYHSYKEHISSKYKSKTVNQSSDGGYPSPAPIIIHIRGGGGLPLTSAFFRKQQGDRKFDIKLMQKLFF